MVQRTYGKQGEDIDKITKIFLKVLDGYEPGEVIDAVRLWIIKSPEFPAPSDILSILRPQQKFDYAVYSALQNAKRSGERLSAAEWEYIRRYEKNAIEG